MVEWSRAFGGAPIYLHADDRQWVMRPDPAIVFWEGDTLELGPGLTLLRLGGHFAGAQVLHWAGGADGRGVLLAGDILQVVQDRRFVSFMYSYPNYIPLPAATVRRMLALLEPLPVRAGLRRVVRRRGARATPRKRCAARPSATSAPSRPIDSRPRSLRRRSRRFPSAVLAFAGLDIGSAALRLLVVAAAAPEPCHGGAAAAARRPLRSEHNHAHRHHRRRATVDRPVMADAADSRSSTTCE